MGGPLAPLWAGCADAVLISQRDGREHNIPAPLGMVAGDHQFNNPVLIGDPVLAFHVNRLGNNDILYQCKGTTLEQEIQPHIPPWYQLAGVVCMLY